MTKIGIRTEQTSNNQVGIFAAVWKGNWIEMSSRLKGRVLGTTQIEVDPAKATVPLWLC